MALSESNRMLGMESQRTVVRERMKMLLSAHDNEIIPTEMVCSPGDVLLEQGKPSRRVLLLTEGTVAIQLREGNSQPHTLAVIEAEELLGEMGLFGQGIHSADVVVIEKPAKLIAVDADQLLKAMLFDADLSIELLNLMSERCSQANQLVGLLLDGINAAHSANLDQLDLTCKELRKRLHSIAQAADYLTVLSRQ